MDLWAEDFKFYLAMALRAVGVALAGVGWISVFGSEAQQTGDLHAHAVAAAAVIGVCLSHCLDARPPSAAAASLVRRFERDLLVVAAERAGGESAQSRLLATRMAALAIDQIRQGSHLPRDRRAWLRILARLAES